tara:strand:+ start:973 stop:1812 length:840 start_codon:yes stop_codon:yes gene_type:complete
MIVIKNGRSGAGILGVGIFGRDGGIGVSYELVIHYTRKCGFFKAQLSDIMYQTMIHFKQVTKNYPGDVHAIRGMNLHVQPGELVSIVGESGAGKSTMVKLLIAEESPTKGSIVIGGWDISDIRPHEVPILRRQIGVIFQDFKLLQAKTIFENVAFALEVVGASPSHIRKVVPQVLEIVGLEDKMHRYPRHVSGGEQQRAVIARALVHKPKIIVADEPTGNLDAHNSKDIVEILKRVNDFGTTVLLVTHDKDIVNHLKRRVVTLRKGHIQADREVGRYTL